MPRKQNCSPSPSARVCLTRIREFSLLKGPLLGGKGEVWSPGCCGFLSRCRSGESLVLYFRTARTVRFMSTLPKTRTRAAYEVSITKSSADFHKRKSHVQGYLINQNDVHPRTLFARTVATLKVSSQASASSYGSNRS